MSTNTSPKTKKSRTGLAWNMMAILLPATLIPTLIMGILVYTRSRTLLIEQISERMRIFVSQASSEIDGWLLDKNLSMERLSRNDDFVLEAETFAQLSETDPAYAETRNELIALLRTLNPQGAEPLFNYFLITNNQGEIILSSNIAWEGMTLQAQPYYLNRVITNSRISFIESSAYPFYNQSDPGTDVLLFTSIELLNKDGTLVGHVIGISNSAAIQGTIEKNASFLPENNLFIYDENLNFSGITDLTTYDSLTPHTPTNGQLNVIYQGLDQNALAQAYTGLDGEQVLGIYTFYEPLNLGILIETPRSRSLQAIESLAPFAVGLIAGAILLISLFIYLGARRISNPLNELSRVAHSFAQGNWEARSNIKRTDEIGLLADTFNDMATDLGNLYREMENQVEERTRQVITATEVSNIATNASNLDELLDTTVNLITDRFSLTHSSIYLVDDTRETASLRSATSVEGRNLAQQGHKIAISENSIYKWVLENNQGRRINTAEGDPDQLHFVSTDEAAELAIIPISVGSNVFGFIEAQSQNQGKISPATLDILTTLANQLASAIQNFRLLEGTEVDLQQISHLYEASQTITKASTKEEIFNAIVTGIQQTSFFAAAYKPVNNELRLIESTSKKPYYEDSLPKVIPLSGKLARMFFDDDLPPVIVRDLVKPLVPIRPELFDVAKSMNAQETAFIPIIVNDELISLIILSSRDRGKINAESLQPFQAFAHLIAAAFQKVVSFQNTQTTLNNLKTLTDFSNKIINETDSDKLYSLIHEQIKGILGEVDFFAALYDDDTKHIEIPYLYEGENPLKIDPFPMGEGLTSIVIRTQKPLMLVENTEDRARALGAKIVGQPAKSWIGIPLIVSGNVIGVLSVQDVEHEHRFTEDDLNLLEALSTPIAGAIQSSRLLTESEKRAYQLRTSAEIAQETSTTLDQDELLKHAVKLVQDRFNFYHASVFLIDASGEYAVIQESTGEAGRQMISEGHRLKIGSQSVIGYVTENKTPLVVNDVAKEPTHRFNPLLPETRAELGIPIMLGDKVLGALDVQSDTPYSFSADDVEVLQILANQLAVAIINANLFTETQEHLAQHRLIHHVTTVSASSTNINDALSSAVQGLRVTLGDYVTILLIDTHKRMLQVSASSGYDQDLVGMQVEVGEGITGWVAEHNEALIINDVKNDPRYIPAAEKVRSELAVPLVYRGETLGVLNVESEIPNAYDEHDQDILGTLAGSLAAIIVTARLSERQHQLFDITNKIRQSVNMNTILETTAEELSKAIRARRTRIQVGGSFITSTKESENGKEGENA